MRGVRPAASVRAARGRSLRITRRVRHPSSLDRLMAIQPPPELQIEVERPNQSVVLDRSRSRGAAIRRRVRRGGVASPYARAAWSVTSDDVPGCEEERGWLIEPVTKENVFGARPRHREHHRQRAFARLVGACDGLGSDEQAGRAEHDTRSRGRARPSRRAEAGPPGWRSCPRGRICFGSFAYLFGGGSLLVLLRHGGLLDGPEYAAAETSALARCDASAGFRAQDATPQRVLGRKMRRLGGLEAASATGRRRGQSAQELQVPKISRVWLTSE